MASEEDWHPGWSSDPPPHACEYTCMHKCKEKQVAKDRAEYDWESECNMECRVHPCLERLTVV